MTVYVRKDGSFSETLGEAYVPFVAPVITSVTEFAANTLRIVGTDGNAGTSTSGYGYELQRKEDDGPFELVFRTITARQANFTFDDVFPTDVPRNRTFTYRIKSFNKFEDAPFSNEDSIILATNLLTVVLDPLSRLDRTISLTWTNGGGAAGDNIEIFKSVGGSGFALLATLTPPILAFDDVFDFLQLEATTYDYKVRHVKPTDTGDFSNTEQIVIGFDLSAITLNPPSFINPTQVQFTWTDPNAPGDEAGITIERAIGPNGIFVSRGEVDPFAPALFNDFGFFEPGQTFRYRVRPFNSAQPGPNSNIQNVAADLLIPEIQTLTQIGDTGVKIVWTSDNTQATEILIKRDDGGGFFQIAVIPFGTFEFNDLFLADVGTLHTYSLRDQNPQTTGAFSPNRTIELSTTLSAPTNLSPVFVNENRIRITWTDINTTHRETIIERKPEGGSFSAVGTVLKGTAFFFDDNFATVPGEVYSYRIHDENNQEVGSNSDEAAVAAPLLTARNFRVDSIVNLVVTLLWDDDNTKEDGYIIERATGVTGTFSELGRVGVDVTTFVDTVPNVPGQAFLYRARAFRNSLELGEILSPLSAQANTAVVLIAPVSAAVQRSDGLTMRITWLDTSNTVQDGYRIFKRVGAGNFNFLAQIDDPDARLFDDQGPITVGTQLSYRVVAFNAVTQSPESNTTSLTPRLDAPTTTANQTTDTDASITVTMPAGFAPIGSDEVRLTKSVNGGLEATIATVAAAAPDVTIPDATLGSNSVGDRISYSAQLTGVDESGPFSAPSLMVVRAVVSLPDPPRALFSTTVNPFGSNIIPAVASSQTRTLYLTGAAGTIASIGENPTNINIGAVTGTAIVSMVKGTGNFFVHEAGVIKKVNLSLTEIASVDLNSATPSAAGGWTPGSFSLQGSMSGYADLLTLVASTSSGNRIVVVDTDTMTVVLSFLAGTVIPRAIATVEGIVTLATSSKLRIYNYTHGALNQEINLTGLLPLVNSHDLVNFAAGSTIERKIIYLTSRQMIVIDLGVQPASQTVVNLDVLEDLTNEARWATATVGPVGTSFYAVATVDNRVFFFEGTTGDNINLTQTVTLEGAPGSIHGIAFQDSPGFTGFTNLHVAKSSGQVVRFTKPFTSDQFVSAT